MNKPKVRQRYINLHGDDRHFITMLEQRNKEFLNRVMSERGLSLQDAKLLLDELDRLDEEMDLD